MTGQHRPKQIQIFVMKFTATLRKVKVMKISIMINGVIIYKGGITSYTPTLYITPKEKGYISNLLERIEKGSKKEWIKLKDGTTITITTL